MAVHSKMSDEIQVPDGTPAWITADLLRRTLATWQPRYEQPLTSELALEILLNASRLLDLFEASDDETVFSAREGLQP